MNFYGLEKFFLIDVTYHHHRALVKAKFFGYFQIYLNQSSAKLKHSYYLIDFR